MFYRIESRQQLKTSELKYVISLINKIASIDIENLQNFDGL